MGEVIKLNRYDTSNINATLRGAMDSPTVVVHRPADEQRGTSTGQLRTEDIYAAPEALKPELSNALNLLRDSADILAEAIQSAQEHSALAADDAIERFVALLPELFCCRSIGDGFGAVVQTLHYCLYNNEGQPLPLERIKALQASVEGLRRNVFMPFDEAVDIIEALEKTDFDTEPRSLRTLTDLMNEQGLS